MVIVALDRIVAIDVQASLPLLRAIVALVARGSTVQVPASFFWNRKNKWAEAPRHLLL